MSSTSRATNIVINDVEKTRRTRPVPRRMMTPSGRHPVDFSQTPLPHSHRKWANPVWSKEDRLFRLIEIPSGTFGVYCLRNWVLHD